MISSLKRLDVNPPHPNPLPEGEGVNSLYLMIAGQGRDCMEKWPQRLAPTHFGGRNRIPEPSPPIRLTYTPVVFVRIGGFSLNTQCFCSNRAFPPFKHTSHRSIKQGTRLKMVNHRPIQQGMRPKIVNHKPIQQSTNPKMSGHSPNEQGTTPNKTGHRPIKQGTTPNMSGHRPNEQGTRPKMVRHKPNEQGTRPK